MRVVTAAVITAFLCGPAFGQAQQPMQKYGEPDKEKTPGEMRSEKEAEKAYRRSLGNIPEQKPHDPWGTVRSDNSAKPADKPAAAAKKAKTGTGEAKTGGATKTGAAAN